MTARDRDRIRAVAGTLLAAVWLAGAAVPGIVAASGGNIGFLEDAPLNRLGHPILRVRHAARHLDQRRFTTLLVEVPEPVELSRENPMIRQAWLTLPSCFASSSTPTLLRMIFSSLVIVSSPRSDTQCLRSETTPPPSQPVRFDLSGYTIRAPPPAARRPHPP